MSKIKIGADALVMLAAIVLSERVDVFLIYGACAALHELGHLVAAKARGIAIKEMRFGLSGVRICTEEGAGSYADELILCMGGPLVNVIIVCMGAVSAVCTGIPLDVIVGKTESYLVNNEVSSIGIAAFFVICAAVQGCVNLLPIKTLDGGRMLYCLCGMLLTPRAADRIVGAASAACAFVIWTVALYLMLKIGAGLGIYVFCACLFFSTLRDRELVKN